MQLILNGGDKYMGRKKLILLPQQSNRLKQMGNQIRLARLRRKLPTSLVAERAGISRQSVSAVEQGSPSVSIGIIANILLAIGLQEDLLLLAKDDVLGRTLQDCDLKNPRRKRVQHAT